MTEVCHPKPLHFSGGADLLKQQQLPHPGHVCGDQGICRAAERQNLRVTKGVCGMMRIRRRIRELNPGLPRDKGPY